MPGVIGRRRILLAVAVSALVVALGAPSVAFGQDVSTTTTTAPPPADEVTAPAPDAAGKPSGGGGPTPQPQPAPARISIFVHGIHKDHKLKVGKRVRAVGYLKPFVAGQQVHVQLLRRGKVIRQGTRDVKKVKGAYKGVFRFQGSKLIRPSTYKVIATHEYNTHQARAVVRSHKFQIAYPDVDPGNHNSTVKIFNKLLKKQGYFTSGGKTYSTRTEWAVMAVRKVNGMNRTYNANPRIFRMLAARKAEFHLAYPHKGKHVEVDISRQVMVLANHGRAQHTFPVSTGAPATPTIRGHFHFYRKDPGYNSVGMYYSVYFQGGYATHGYHSVPPYNASHGCVRNPIPDSIFIYNWIDLGDSIWVYG
jgi:lipoprotein-anchoring transpeptidase ErfK/SrfK